MTTLEKLLEDMIEKKGALYLAAFNVAKHYIETHSELALEKEIRRFQNPRVFPYLFSLGIPWRLQMIAMQRWRELSEVSKRRFPGAA